LTKKKNTTEYEIHSSLMLNELNLSGNGNFLILHKSLSVTSVCKFLVLQYEGENPKCNKPLGQCNNQ